MSKWVESKFQMSQIMFQVPSVITLKCFWLLFSRISMSQLCIWKACLIFLPVCFPLVMPIPPKATPLIRPDFRFL